MKKIHTTDLSRTKWLFNENLLLSNLGEFAINFDSNNASFDALCVTDVGMTYNNTLAYGDYVFTLTIINGTYVENPSPVDPGTREFVILPDAGYEPPETIEVSGADYEYLPATGQIITHDPRGNVFITAECTAIVLEPPVLTLDSNIIIITAGDRYTQAFNLYEGNDLLGNFPISHAT